MLDATFLVTRQITIYSSMKGIFRFIIQNPEVALILVVLVISLFMLSKFSDFCIKKYRGQNDQDNKNDCE